ncbi:MAG: cysteine desulfurase [Gammaproteobacteria bacterium]|nr:cysteine desulfurase [Gammaproteobacteria bacterium]MDH5735211.1 cysteine desulfurase [Gammaproteobacteria bacterium]
MSVYLDNNSTTALDPQVLDAMLPYFKDIHGNPSSVHRYGRLTRNALEQARDQVARLAGARNEQVIFTSGGTEANNLAILGALSHKAPAHLAVSSIEHASIIEPAKSLFKKGWKLDLVNVDSGCYILADNLKSVISEDTRLVSVMMANNETGVVQDIQSLKQGIQSDQILFHSDASQVAGKLPLNFNEINIDMMTLSSHKIYGPQGAGALIANRSIELEPVLYGGGQERGIRNGTENIAAIVGFGAAAELAIKQLEETQKHLRSLRDQLERELAAMQNITLFAAESDRLPNTLQFAVNDFDGEALLMLLDKKGIAVSSGSACQSSAGAPSHVLLAMGVKPELAKHAIRVSFGRNNIAKDVQILIEALKDITLIQHKSMCVG